jgi:hypothetical protein
MMSEVAARWCVFLPCAKDEIWVVPQNSLAEIVTVQDGGRNPPGHITWRGEDVPVLDLGESGEIPWRNPMSETGLIAVILGLKGTASGYWAVALRGEGLAVKNIANEKVQDVPEKIMVRSTAAFEINNIVYQVPDLPALQIQVRELRLSA